MAAWIKPAQGSISSQFGKRTAPTPGASTFHAGVDIGASNGSPVVASASGIVAFAGLAGGFGGLARIDHAGPDETYYAHLSYIGVRYGQWVAQGQVIGASGGRKGQWGAGTSNGSHLHFEHRIDGKAVDPVPYWSSTASGDITPITPTKDEDDEMAKTTGIFTKDEKGQQLNALVNPTSGFFSSFLSSEGGYNSAVGEGFETGNFVPVSLSHFRKIESDCASVRDGK